MNYNSRCPTLRKVKVKVAQKSGIKDKSKETEPIVWNDKDHIVCFACNKRGHYHNQCPNVKQSKGHRRGSSCQRGDFKVKRKVIPKLNLNSIIAFSMHWSSNYIHLLM